ncbi:MAG: hypothetical protein WA743_08480 [Pseudolabrys sp.]
MFNRTREFIALCAAALILSTVLTPSYAHTGSVAFRVAKAGFIVGIGGGSGVLHFEGKTYHLKIGGLSAGTIGVAQAELVGVARHLRVAEDIAGNYTAVSAGFAVAGGGKTAHLQNSKGVVLELRGRQVGFELSLNLSGLTISIE